MAFLIDQAYLPATLTVAPMTDEQFAEFCSEHSDLFFEMTADGELLVMPPNNPLSGARNLELSMQLGFWARSDGRGIGFDSSTGFVLPSGARRSADAAWLRKERIPTKNRSKAWHLCPDFVIELRSETDRLRPLREKMAEWIENGAEVAWLIDPEKETVEIYRQGRDVEIVQGNEVLGDGPVDEFVLDLAPIWDPFR